MLLNFFYLIYARLFDNEKIGMITNQSTVDSNVLNPSSSYLFILILQKGFLDNGA